MVAFFPVGLDIFVVGIFSLWSGNFCCGNFFNWLHFISGKPQDHCKLSNQEKANAQSEPCRLEGACSDSEQQEAIKGDRRSRVT